uniref:Uncharacterized protein n=1 Tax=Arundo donax TaxID=35708 RepID=A0A0A9GFT1_ARUDO
MPMKTKMAYSNVRSSMELEARLQWVACLTFRGHGRS